MEDKTASATTRTEHDLLGTMEIDAGDLRGIHTLRAAENFVISGRPVSPLLIRAYALVKKACARANGEFGYLDGRRTGAILAACDEISAGEHAGCFGLDALQGGAGTSTNMNLNEVIANRANVILGLRPGDYAEGVHPLDHVNLHQSTNDTFPTALRVCLIGMVRDAAAAAAELQGAFQRKEREFAPVVTIGRTELRDAVPMTLGAVFSAFAECVGRDRWRTFKCEERLRVVNLGGTAVGTGLTAPRGYIFRVVDALREETGFNLARAENLVDATANADSLVEVAGILSAFASDLIKISRDLRLLSQSGEIRLPAVQAGSSIMPGKVNPVICEAVIQAGMRARSNVALVAEAGSAGTLQINEYMPLLADSTISTLSLLSSAARTLARHVDGMAANPSACAALFDANPMIVTAFLPFIGYERAQELLAEYRDDGRGQTFRDFLADRLGAETVDRVLSPESLSSLGYKEKL